MPRPVEMVTKRVGRRMSRAVPTQKRMKERAVPKARRIVLMLKPAKMRRGGEESASWM